MNLYIVKEKRPGGYTVRSFHPTVMGGWSKVLVWFDTRAEAKNYIASRGLS